MRQADINKYFMIGILIAISLGVVALIRSYRSIETMTLLGHKQNYDNSDVWSIDMNKNTEELQFIYRGNLTSDGEKVMAMTLTKDGVCTVNRGFSFAKPINRSWLITPDKYNALILGNKKNGGMKINSDGSILPLKYMGGGSGGPIDLSKLCRQDDGSGLLYGGSCTN